MEKVCTQCGEEKPLSEYHRNRSARDGHRTECKACMCSRTRRYYAEHLRERYDTGPVAATCEQCSKDFEYLKTTGPRRKYCEERCKYQAGELLKQSRAPEHVRRCPCGSPNVARVGIPRCPDCKTDKRDPAKAAARDRRRILALYNITQADWDAMVERQSNRCATCKSDTPGGRGESWSIDHDHLCCPGKGSCGRCVRGLLCSACNRTLGAAGDDPDLLRVLAVYVEAWRQLTLAA
jgi:hypothetical protein